jgi:hypothetical protein
MAILSLDASTDALFSPYHWHWEEFPYYEWAREAPDSVLTAARKLAIACHGDTDFCSDSLYAINKADSPHKNEDNKDRPTGNGISLRFPVQIPKDSLLPLIDIKSAVQAAGASVVETIKCHKSNDNWHIMTIRTSSIEELVGILNRATESAENQRRMGMRGFRLPQTTPSLVISA